MTDFCAYRLLPAGGEQLVCHTPDACRREGCFVRGGGLGGVQSPVVDADSRLLAGSLDRHEAPSILSSVYFNPHAVTTYERYGLRARFAGPRGLEQPTPENSW